MSYLIENEDRIYREAKAKMTEANDVKTRVLKEVQDDNAIIAQAFKGMSCGNCLYRFWTDKATLADGKEIFVGFCRRGPPTPVFLMQPAPVNPLLNARGQQPVMQTGIVPQWAPTNSAQACGEWKGPWPEPNPGMNIGTVSEDDGA